MASRIPMQVYEDTITHTDEHSYEQIKIDKKENNVNLSRKQWFNIFLLILALSLATFGLGFTVTYFILRKLIHITLSNDRIQRFSYRGGIPPHFMEGSIPFNWQTESSATVCFLCSTFVNETKLLKLRWNTHLKWYMAH